MTFQEQVLDRYRTRLLEELNVLLTKHDFTHEHAVRFLIERHTSSLSDLLDVSIEESESMLDNILNDL